MNVACGLGRLGVDTHLLTRIGNDFDGAATWKRLKDAGVQVVESSFDSSPTSFAVATLRDDGSTDYELDFQWTLPSLVGLKLQKWLHVGSLGTFVSPGADSLELFLRSVSGSTTISYDPNIPPSFVCDHDSLVARFERIAGLSQVVRLSSTDAGRLYPGLTAEFVVDKVLSLGVRVVALTRGVAGAVLSTHSHTIEAPAPRVTFVDGVGAGDSFTSALILGLLATGRDPGNAKLAMVARRAVLAASLTCTRAGGEPPTLDELTARSS
jgi:fructokinase